MPRANKPFRSLLSTLGHLANTSKLMDLGTREKEERVLLVQSLFERERERTCDSMKICPNISGKGFKGGITDHTQMDAFCWNSVRARMKAFFSSLCWSSKRSQCFECVYFLCKKERKVWCVAAPREGKKCNFRNAIGIKNSFLLITDATLHGTRCKIQMAKEALFGEE